MGAFCHLPSRARRGSLPRCLLLTEGSKELVSSRLNRLVEPFAHIDAGRHYWMPRGLHEPREARLGESPQLLTDPSHRNDVKKWYLEVFGPTTNTPNWDIAASATFNGGKEGLVLVEAKAHVNELHIAGKPFRTTGPKASDPLRHKRIGEAIAEAGVRLNAIEPGFSLSRDSHYQLSNRFAWAWKVASMGVPVLLVYLGFLNADEMRDRGSHFTSADD